MWLLVVRVRLAASLASTRASDAAGRAPARGPHGGGGDIGGGGGGGGSGGGGGDVGGSAGEGGGEGGGGSGDGETGGGGGGGRGRWYAPHSRASCSATTETSGKRVVAIEDIAVTAVPILGSQRIKAILISSSLMGGLLDFHSRLSQWHHATRFRS